MLDRLRHLVGRVRSSPWQALAAGGAGAALLWVFWPALADLADRWGHDSQYSHGFLVPLFSLYLLWSRRALAPAAWQPAWWGFAVLLAGLGMRVAGTAFFIHWLAAASLIPCLAGLFALAGGLRALRWAWPALAFLLFMVPLPYRAEAMLAHPLQRVATVASTYLLQTLGFAASAEGNVIRMGTVRLGVVEACSGLAMLISFFALSTAVALVVRRPLLDRLVIFASAVPIALASNILRITVTGVLHKTVCSTLANFVFHDLAGWLMMPLALGFLWLFLRLLAVVLVARPDAAAPLRPAAVGGLVPGLALPGKAGPKKARPRPRDGKAPAKTTSR